MALVSSAAHFAGPEESASRVPEGRRLCSYLSRAIAAAMPDTPPARVTASDTYVINRARFTRQLRVFPDMKPASSSLNGKS